MNAITPRTFDRATENMSDREAELMAATLRDITDSISEMDDLCEDLILQIAASAHPDGLDHAHAEKVKARLAEAAADIREMIHAYPVRSTVA